MSRREFIKSSTLAGSAAAVAGATGIKCSSPRTKNVAVQLYTLRELMTNDFEGTIKKVAQIGYDGVEFAGYYGRSAAEVKKLIDDLDLICVGTHDGFEALDTNLDKVIDFNLEIGAQFMTCPSLPGELREDGANSFRKFGARLSEIGQTCNDAGIQLCYHNHSFEFVTIDGRYGFDLLFESADPDLVKAEVDVYWVQYGGEDPAALIQRYPNRCPLLHMKDMAEGEDKDMTEVGDGILDMAAIIDAGVVGGTEWYIVERDRGIRPPLESIEISLRNMRQMLA